MDRATATYGRTRGQPRGGRGRGRGQGDPAARGTSHPHSGGTNTGRGRGRGVGHAEGQGQGQGVPFTRGAQRGAGRGARGTSIFMQDKPGAVDARLADDSDKALVAGLDRSLAGPGGLPLRTDFGTEGKAILLRVNHFPAYVKGTIYRYSVTISLPAKQVSRRVKRRVFDLAERTVDWRQAGMSDRVAHDGAEKLVASFLLPQPMTIRGPYYEDDAGSEGSTSYMLTLTYEEEVDQQILNECLAGKPVDSQALPKVLSALNLVLTAQPSRTGVKIGRDDDSKKHPDQRIFFHTPDPKDIGGGLAVREGFYMSARPAHRQLMVNVNTSHAAFYKPQNFADAIKEYRQFVGSNDMGAFGTQVRVKTKDPEHTMMIQGLSRKSAREHNPKFKADDLGLRHPDLPLLEGRDGKLYPPEVCDILQDQSFKGELHHKKHTAAMLDIACKLPKVNANEIVNRGLDMLGFRNSNPVLDSFGISVGSDMAVVPGRILEKPGLAYSSDVPAAIDDRASWNLRDVKFAVGARLEKWAILVVKDGNGADFGGTEDRDLWDIARGFQNMCSKSGMQGLRKPAYVEVQLPQFSEKANRFRDDALEALERALTGVMRQSGPELVLVMLSSGDKKIYDGLKSLCDLKLDIATVCMQSDKVRKVQGRQQYFANVALKVNMKLGGINHKLDANSGVWLRSASTMVMGMDVTHPARGVSVQGTPSIVAVVASVDEHFAQYPATLALRRSKVEIDRNVDNSDNVLRDMFISRLELYKARNRGKLPERVILYRDGVSESQFVQVRGHELPQMRMAFKRFDSAGAPYQPRLSIVVCGKRHHTRFYPTKADDAAFDGNPLPGTVVDRGVAPVYEFDFFLQAHGGLKGTTRPTHYFVVHDENGFKADTLQRVTHDLSYMFARATKAVSLVSPAYWADVACERGRCYLHKMLRGGAAGDGGKKRSEDEVFERAVGMWGDGVSGPKLRDTMFYL